MASLGQQIGAVVEAVVFRLLVLAIAPPTLAKFCFDAVRIAIIHPFRTLHWLAVRGRPAGSASGERPAPLKTPCDGRLAVKHLYIPVSSSVVLHAVEAEGTGGGAKNPKLLLFLHGFPELWYSWRSQMSEFRNEFRAVAVDLRGYGESSKPAEVAAYRMEELVKDVASLIQKLGHERCYLVGHDWGGVLAWMFAHKHPEMVDRLVVMNAPHPACARENFGLRQLIMSSYIFAFQVPRLPELIFSFADFGLLASTMCRSARGPIRFSEEDVSAYKWAWARAGAMTAGVNWYRANALPPFSADEAARRTPRGPLNVPTCVIWGLEDAFLRRDLLTGIERFVPGMRFCGVPGTGHWVQQEAPAECNRHMRAFLCTP